MGEWYRYHRFWEAIYCETIPVTKNHYLYESFENVPKVIESYSDLLNLPLYNAPNNDTNIPITLNYWEEIIKTNSNKILDENIKFKISKLDINLSIKLFEKLISKEELEKSIYFLRKLSNKMNNFLNVLSFKS